MRYEITNRPFTILTIHLEKGESVRSKPEALAWMSPNIRMETKIDDLANGLKKVAVGRTPIHQRFIAEEEGDVSLALKVPGDILTFDVSETPVIIQKKSFLASTEDINLDVYLHEDIATGLFGGTGFLMEQYTGKGNVWVGVSGSLTIRELEPGEKLTVTPSHVAAMETSCSMNVIRVKGAGNVVLGGTGIFHTVITGPGRVWLQTMPVSSLEMQIEQLSSWIKPL